MSYEKQENYLQDLSWKQTWTSCEEVMPKTGIFVYRNIITPEMDIINRLENVLSNSDRYKWMDALVGYAQKIPEYRDCYDFKFKKENLQNDLGEDSLNLQKIWQDCYDRKAEAVKHYSKTYNINNLRYWEAFNFVKYGPGQHFQEHHDHGFSYNCTVSLVSYINDDYEGGELYFRLQDLKIKPKAGDLYIFPSTFMYPHRAMPVHSGTKYSIVTMLDYSAKYHTPSMYQDTGN